jgi:hypothetical protein
MAVTLTNLIPLAVAALDTVSRELVGFIPGVTRNSTADALATNQTLQSPIHPTLAGADMTAAMGFPAEVNITYGTRSMTLNKNRRVAFSWSGEETNSAAQGMSFEEYMKGNIEQAFRTLVNEMETDIATAAYLGASRAFGTSGTTPFASTLADPAQIKKILDDNGAPMGDRSLVINTTAGVALRSLTLLTNANQANSDLTLRAGQLLDIHGFAIRESARVQSPTSGTGASYLINNTGGYAVGATTIAVDGGTGTILAGDIVTIASNKYVVATALAAGSFTINTPGLITTVADDAAITVNAAGARNIAHTRDAIVLATRLPMMGNDLAVDSQVITDPRSGISFDLRAYPGFGMTTYTVHALWGVMAAKPAHIAILQG